jgi:hypothetical protein
MSNVVALSKAGSLADLEVALEVVDIQRPFLLDQWALVVLVHQVVQAGSEVVSVVVSTEEDEADSGAASKIAVAEGEVLATKVVEASPEAVMAEEIVVGIVARTEPLHPMHPLVQVVLVVVASAAATAEAGMEAQIATVLACQGQLVGMTVVAAAHMMTDPADTAAAAVEVMGIVMHLEVEVVATWSR